MQRIIETTAFPLLLKISVPQNEEIANGNLRILFDMSSGF